MFRVKVRVRLTDLRDAVHVHDIVLGGNEALGVK